MDNERSPDFSKIPKAKEIDLSSKNTVSSCSVRSGSGSEPKGTPEGRHSRRWRQRQAALGKLCAQDSGNPQVLVGQTEGRQRTLSCLWDPPSTASLGCWSISLPGYRAPEWVWTPSSLREGWDGISLCSAAFQDFLGNSHSLRSPVQGLRDLLCLGNTSPPRAGHSLSLVLVFEQQYNSCWSFFWEVLFFFPGSSSFPEFAAPDDGYSIRALFTSCTLAGKQFITAFLKILIKAN